MNKMTETTYTSKDIRVLNDIETIRINADMYIGSTEKPTHLVEECLDNALDEIMGGYGNIIAIMINTETNIISVLDDGRGIPIEDNVPITIATKLHSGAKFQDNKSAYSICAGLHGLGLVAVNGLSDFVNIEIYKNNKHGLFKFKDSILKSKIIEKYDGDRPFSTKIEFKPSDKIFDELTPDIERIRQRLLSAIAELDNDKVFVLNVDDKKEIFKMDIDQYYRDYCLEGDNKSSNIIKLNTSIKEEKYDLMFSYSENGSIAPKVLSSINLLPVKSGGTHINLLFDILKDYFMLKGKKHGYLFQPNDCLARIRVYTILRLIESKYTSQTKDKLSTKRAYLEPFGKQIRINLEKHFNDNEDQLQDLLELFQNHRSRLDSKKLKNTNGKKRGSTKFTKLRDCSSRNGKLFLLEGESAAGTLLQSRDPKVHAVFPLKGKVMNIINKKDVLKNKEISELIMALGCGYGHDFNIDDLRYEGIYFFCDADADGKHIASLLIILFALLLPELIKQGKVFIVETPLFAINEKNAFVPLWTRESLELAQTEKRHITRYKGIGEFNAKDLKIVVLNDETNKITQVEYTDDIDKHIKLFSDVSTKRKLLNGEF